MNQADSAGIAAELDAKDLTRADSAEDAEIVVLNTCTVTHRSDADVRKTVRRVKRENPGAKVIVTGCYAQRAPDDFVRLGGVAAVVGNRHKNELSSLVERLADDAPIVLHSPIDRIDPADLPPVDTVTTVLDRTRPFVKIQDGCDAACTYCIIPAVRGRAKSAEPDRVVDAVRDLVAEGYVEIVLTGVHLGTYAGSSGGVDARSRADLSDGRELADLVRRVLEVPGLVRLRMSCIEPMAFPIALAELARESSRLAPHFHLPLQSGSNEVLKRMVRPYRTRDFSAIIDDIRARVPHACIGTDVIAGFPGETDAQFEETMRFVADSTIDYVHVFSYSDRSGTSATSLGPKVDPREIKARVGALNALGKELWGGYLDRQIGKTLSAVTLARRAGVLVALSDNYCPIRLAEALDSNRLVDVFVTARDGERLVGHVIG